MKQYFQQQNGSVGFARKIPQDATEITEKAFMDFQLNQEKRIDEHAKRMDKINSAARKKRADALKAQA